MVGLIGLADWMGRRGREGFKVRARFFELGNQVRSGAVYCG